MEFPSSPEISDFDEIPVDPEYPLSDSGRWRVYGNRFEFIGHIGHIATGTEFAVNGQFYTPRTFRADGELSAEVWACAPGAGLGAANESQRLLMWLDDPESAVGYLFGYGGGVGELYFARRYNGSFTSWTELGEWGSTSRDALGMRITPVGLEFWRRDGGVWSIVGTVADITHRGTFYAALEAESQGCTDCIGFGCFGGGEVQRTQLIRWAPPINDLAVA